MSQFVGGNLCWRFLRKFTFGGFYFGDFLHLQELGVARVNYWLILYWRFISLPPIRQQIDSYGSYMYKASREAFLVSEDTLIDYESLEVGRYVHSVGRANNNSLSLDTNVQS